MTMIEKPLLVGGFLPINFILKLAGIKRPKVPYHLRTCIVCNLIEDEFHALYTCKAHKFIRCQYKDLLVKYDNISKLFNPQSLSDIKSVATYIHEVEENMKTLKMLQ